jgi:hypothetical protein
MTHYKITHTEYWSYKRNEHDDITLPKQAMLAYLGDLLWSSAGVEIDQEGDGEKFNFTHNFIRADGDLDTMEHVVWVERIEEGEKQ